MPEITIKRFATPDETRTFEKGRAEILHLDEATIGRGVFEPGWRWSQCVKPIAGTESCEVAHVGFVLSGRMHVRMDDGEEAEVGPGDVVTIAPGHDEWVVGNETCILLDFGGMERYAERAEEGRRPGALPSQPAAY